MGTRLVEIVWEYLVAPDMHHRDRHISTESDLNELGALGWELVSVMQNNNGVMCFYFKRKKIVEVADDPDLGD